MAEACNDGAHSEQYAKMEFEHLRFQRPVVEYIHQATQTRSTDTYNDEHERKICEEGVQLIREIQEWQQKSIPPYFVGNLFD